MKLLVLTAEVPEADVVRDIAAEGDEIYVVAPALEDSPLRFWVSDVDDAVAKARETAAATVAGLRDEGVEAAGDTGEAEPLQAAEDALAVFAADRIIVLTHEGGDKAYREDDLAGIRDRLDVPVELRHVARTSS